MVTFTEELLDGKLHLLCSGSYKRKLKNRLTKNCGEEGGVGLVEGFRALKHFSLQINGMDWFLYNRDLSYDRVKQNRCVGERWLKTDKCKHNMISHMWKLQ